MKNKCYSVDRDISIKIVKKEGQCPFDFSPNQIFELTQILPLGMNLCLFHNIYPYWLTLIQGGEFPWNREENKVLIQCPKDKDGVVLEIERGLLPEKSVIVNVLEKNSSCLENVPLNHEFILNEKDPIFCPHALNVLFPYVNILINVSSDSVLISCPGCDMSRIIFELSSR